MRPAVCTVIATDATLKAARYQRLRTAHAQRALQQHTSGRREHRDIRSQDHHREEIGGARHRHGRHAAPQRQPQLEVGEQQRRPEERNGEREVRERARRVEDEENGSDGGHAADIEPARPLSRDIPAFGGIWGEDAPRRPYGSNRASAGLLSPLTRPGHWRAHCRSRPAAPTRKTNDGHGEPHTG